MTVVKIAVVAIAGVILLTVLKRFTGTYGVIVEIGLIAVILLAVLPEIKTMFELLKNLGDIEFLDSTAMKILFKAFGILATGAIAADVCRDNSENAVAGVVELGVKILAVSCALPVITAVIEIASSFFNR